MAGYRGGEPVAEVVRSGFVESIHRGSLIVIDDAGNPVLTIGDVDSPFFPRSANKPLQLAGMLRAGLSLSDPADLAIGAGSHHGEPFHVARVAAMLAAGGLDESDLVCPEAFPLNEAAMLAAGRRRRIFMNCSGKHAAMLRTCQAAGWPIQDYVAPDHPLQKALRIGIEEWTGQSVAAVGVDGCGAALFALTPRTLASAFLGLVSAPKGTPERTVADAMRAYPELVAGTEATDTRLMRAVPGLLAKVGAEGVQAVALPGVGALVFKCDDGAARVRLPVTVAALRRLGVDVPAELGQEVVYGGGRPVGEVRLPWT